MSVKMDEMMQSEMEVVTMLMPSADVWCKIHSSNLRYIIRNISQVTR